ncbi:uncharacterized protein LOC128388083 [Panonychus citri]|uniref:uncharacterized protein LOC128388083 n=1 Tax=Panonychus citri TaxID=50023 RepID=UPI00230806A2|nr:uncharacterized protein LOC128388083 [Panonychus citri]
MKLITFFAINIINILTFSIVSIDCQLLTSVLALASLARFLRPRSSFPPSSFYPGGSGLQSSPYDQMQFSSSASHMNPVMVAPPNPFSPMSTQPNQPFGFPMSSPSPLMPKGLFNSPVSDWTRLLQPSESQGIPSIYGQQYPPLGGGFPGSFPGLSSPFSGLTSGLTSGLSPSLSSSLSPGLSSGLPSSLSSSLSSGYPSFSSSLFEPKLPFGLSSMYPFDDYTGQRKRNFRLTPF